MWGGGGRGGILRAKSGAASSICMNVSVQQGAVFEPQNISVLLEQRRFIF